MITKKMYFMDCHLAGRKYHDADEVWDELKVGNVLRLERDKENWWYHGNCLTFSLPVYKSVGSMLCDHHYFLKELKVSRGVLSSGTPSCYLCCRIAEAGCYALAVENSFY